jgi:two-component system CheB/CheR fusion protein
VKDRPGFDSEFLRLRELSRDALARAREACGRARVIRAAVASDKQLESPTQSLREALRHAEASLVARDHFLAVVIHELRQPLATLATASELLAAPNATEDAKARAHRVMRSSITRSSRILDDLLDLSRISLQRLDVAHADVSLRDLLVELGENVRCQMQQKQLQFTITLPADGMAVHGDPDRLHQVFSNLLQNAIKFTGPGGRVELAADTDAEWIRVSVRDSGDGIPPERLAGIFELFSTHDVARRGFGVGLAISRALVHAHHGTIQASSDGPGRGSTFVVTLPCAATSRNAATA